MQHCLPWGRIGDDREAGTIIVSSPVLVYNHRSPRPRSRMPCVVLLLLAGIYLITCSVQLFYR